MRESEQATRIRIREFLNQVDVTDKLWMNTVENYFIKEVLGGGKKDRRVATFSVGDDIENEIDDYVVASLSKETKDAETQCPDNMSLTTTNTPLDEIEKMWKMKENLGYGDVLRLLKRGTVKHRELEGRYDRVTAIALRRELIAVKQNCTFKDFPYQNYSYTNIESCCENVIGYMPIPVGIAGPLTIGDGKNTRTVYVPMATTEGALVASTNRGCTAIQKSGSAIYSRVKKNAMTRAPVVIFPRAQDADEFENWLKESMNYDLIRKAFESTSSVAKLLPSSEGIEVKINGNEAFIKFSAFTGDAMGMNMISLGCQAALKEINKHFPRMRCLALSGNYCVDKKASAVNWINGRGKSVVTDIVLPRMVVESVLKTTPELMAEVAQAKLSDGSALAGCIGGNNAHAANIVAAIFLATGQDAAQVVSSSMCQTKMTVTKEGDLYVSCTMPCLEVGTLGGGTILGPQKEMLQMLSCAGPNRIKVGQNAVILAETIAATVLAGELSLMAALCEDKLVSSHLTYNRSKLQLYDPPHQTHSQPIVCLEQASPADRPTPRARRNCTLQQPGCSNIL